MLIWTTTITGRKPFRKLQQKQNKQIRKSRFDCAGIWFGSAWCESGSVLSRFGSKQFWRGRFGDGSVLSDCIPSQFNKQTLNPHMFSLQRRLYPETLEISTVRESVPGACLRLTKSGLCSRAPFRCTPSRSL